MSLREVPTLTHKRTRSIETAQLVRIELLIGIPKMWNTDSATIEMCNEDDIRVYMLTAYALVSQELNILLLFNNMGRIATLSIVINYFPMIAVFVNIPCPTKKEAESLCLGLLKLELCVTTKIHENVTLMWKEEEKISSDEVVLMTLKTTDVNVPKIHRYMHEHHSWGSPCVEVIPIHADLC